MLAPTTLAVLTCLAASTGEPVRAAAPHALVHHSLVDGVVTGALIGTWIGSEAFKPQLAPATCRWCDTGPGGSDALNAVDRWGRGIRGAPEQLIAFDTASGVVGFAVLPLSMIGVDLLISHSDGALNQAPVDLLIIAEAVGSAMVVNQGVKFLAGRERPFVHALWPEEKALTGNPADNNLSFFSGHTTFAFAVAVATGTVAELRGYRHASLAWAIGLPVAAVVPLLRMGADRHYLTDVLAGAAVGAAFGFGVPTLFHPREGTDSPLAKVRWVPMPGGIAVAGVL